MKCTWARNSSILCMAAVVNAKSIVGTISQCGLCPCAGHIVKEDRSSGSLIHGECLCDCWSFRMQAILLLKKTIPKYSSSQLALNSPSELSPSCLQTTTTSATSQELLQTVPHSCPIQTSTRPSRSSLPPVSLISVSLQSGSA